MMMDLTRMMMLKMVGMKPKVLRNKEVEDSTEEASQDIPSVRSQNNRICSVNNESFDMPSAQPQRDHSL